MAQDDLVGQAVRELYGLELENFIPRRTELARAARAAGDKSAAKEITALRKPNRSGYTLNRLALQSPDSVDRLLDLGDELRKAERALDGPALRELSQQRRRLVADLVREALDITDQHSASPGLREEITGTLNAAVADDQVATALRQGTLIQAAEWSGFGSGGQTHLSLVPAPAQVSESRPAAEKEPAAQEPVPKITPSGSALQAKSAREKAARDQEKAARAEKLRADADIARSRAEDNRKKLREAGERAAQDLVDADRAVETAARALQEQNDHIERLTTELEQARKKLKDSENDLRKAQTEQRAARTAAERARRRLQTE